MLAILPVVIVLCAAVLRLNAVGLGHPFLTFQPDEDANALRALRLAHGELNPLYFYYPALLWYLLAAVYRFAFWFGRELGLLSTWSDFTHFYNSDPTLFYAGRLLSVIFGTATVACLYLLGRRAFSPMHGLLAAAFLAVSFLHVRDSALSTTEAPLTFFVVLALLGAVRVYQDGGLPDYALAAVAGGLATATKYNAVLVFVALGVAHVLRQLDDGTSILRAVWDKRLLAAGLLAGVVFIALNPFLLLDWSNAWGAPTDFGSLAWEWRYVHTVEYLDLRPVWWYHLSVSLRYGMGLALLALALAGALLTLHRWNRVGLVLLSFVLTFFTAMASLQAVFVRYMTPLLPVLCVFAAMTVHAVTECLSSPRARRWTMAGLILLALAEPLQASVAYGRIRHHVDTRIEVFDYTQTELPPGSTVATYGPSVTWRSTMPRWSPQMYAKDPQQSWPDVFKALKSRGTRYFIVHRSPLDVFSPEMPELDRAIRESATLIREFRPYRASSPSAPVYDRNDAYYFPIGGFRGIVRPGPLVQLYRLD
jgi:Dolichyl-phosphate-mannose-protein mannosyltransferase